MDAGSGLVMEWLTHYWIVTSGTRVRDNAICGDVLSGSTTADTSQQAQPTAHQGPTEHSDGWCKAPGGEGCDGWDIGILRVEQETKQSATVGATHTQCTDVTGQGQGGFQQGIG